MRERGPDGQGTIGERGGPGQEPPSSVFAAAAVWTGPSLAIGATDAIARTARSRINSRRNPFEPRRAQLCVARGVRDRHVAEPI